ncbi:hypothetical protein SDC9_125791 [bioreactor metagenome]|uniref:Phage terminase large subunit N-terminal domain-containing protein n=1 Tax=bioreactor metagenome TaxID=1076179 RepID=A0A645CPF1_9ZZZZ
MRTKLILLALNLSGIQILLLRRNFPELRENHINPMRKILYGIAKYRDSTKEFIFPNTSRIKLGYLADKFDALQYQGQSYDCIGMEEATQFTEEQYMAMTECCRVSGMMKAEFCPRMYFTCNPGGVGHAWFKRLFIDKDFHEGESAEDYVFIRSTVYDNEFIMKHNPDYIRNLKSLPPIRRRAMLDGDWDAFEGQYFPEFTRDLHVCEPFVIPSDWLRFACLDYGLDMTACLWLCYPPDLGKLYVYRELYEPDLILSEAAKRIAEAQKNDIVRYICASPDLAGRRQESGMSGFDVMRASGLSKLTAADNARIAGWRRLREFLHTEIEYSNDGNISNDNIKTRFAIFSCCTNLIRTLPKLTFDKYEAEDASRTPHEFTHAPDALRYGVMSLSFLPGKSRFQINNKKEKSLKEEFFGEERGDYSVFMRQ